MKWLTPYQRRLLRRLMKEGKRVHYGRKYIVLIDEERGLIVLNELLSGRKHVLIGKPRPDSQAGSKEPN